MRRREAGWQELQRRWQRKEEEGEGLFTKSTKGGSWDKLESLGSWCDGITWKTSLKLQRGFSTYIKVKRYGKDKKTRQKRQSPTLKASHNTILTCKIAHRDVSMK